MATLRRRKSGAWGARITIPQDVRADYQALYTKHVEEVFYAGPTLLGSERKYCSRSGKQISRAALQRYVPSSEAKDTS
jgi:hypothetical protein